MPSNPTKDLCFKVLLSPCRQKKDQKEDAHDPERVSNRDYDQQNNLEKLDYQTKKPCQSIFVLNVVPPKRRWQRIPRFEGTGFGCLCPKAHRHLTITCLSHLRSSSHSLPGARMHTGKRHSARAIWRAMSKPNSKAGYLLPGASRLGA